MLGSGWFLLALAADKAPLSRWLGRIHRRLGNLPKLSTISAFVKATEKRAGDMLRQPFRILLLYVGASLVQWILMIGEIWLIYFISGLSLSMIQLTGVVAAARLAFLLPMPGALGVLETSQVLILSSFGLDPAIGLTVSIIMRSRDIILVGCGIGPVWSWLSGRTERPFRSFHDPV